MLIHSLEVINTDTAREMAKRCNAQYAAYYCDDRELSLKYINEAIEMNPNIQYARLAKFDICERFGMTSEMEEIVAYFEQPEYKNKYSNNVVIFKSILAAREGNIDMAITYFKDNIKYYTDQAKQNFVNRLQRYSENTLTAEI